MFEGGKFIFKKQPFNAEQKMYVRGNVFCLSCICPILEYLIYFFLNKWNVFSEKGEKHKAIGGGQLLLFEKLNQSNNQSIISYSQGPWLQIKVTHSESIKSINKRNEKMVRKKYN